MSGEGEHGGPDMIAGYESGLGGVLHLCGAAYIVIK